MCWSIPEFEWCFKWGGSGIRKYCLHYFYSHKLGSIPRTDISIRLCYKLSSRFQGWRNWNVKYWTQGNRKFKNTFLRITGLLTLLLICLSKCFKHIFKLLEKNKEVQFTENLQTLKRGGLAKITGGTAFPPLPTIKIPRLQMVCQKMIIHNLIYL